ncbi:MAG: binding-protein-dependent transporter inner membrane component [Chloroflexi bacterium CSP1-4]|nr:MAG: binding-protein-dependent transporter inner membrane component [Chloroflexi bacterium CSP1-4]
MEGTQLGQIPAKATTGAGQGAVDEVDLTPVRTYWQLARQRFMQHSLAVVGLIVMAILVTLALVVPTITGSLYAKTSLSLANHPPSLLNPFAPLGYDSIGMNVFIRLVKALQTSLFVGFSAVSIIVVVGITVGAIAGYVGGAVDNLLMRLVDVVLSLPSFFLIVMMVALFGTGNAIVVIVAIGIVGWTTAARLVRAEFLSLRETDFVQAARALGAGDRRIIVRHMLPAAMAPVVVAATLGIADSVVVEATLSFLSFGISPPEASLGNMLTNAQEFFYRQPILILYPGLTLILVVLAASFMGDGLRDALDPRQRVRK